MLAKAFVVGKVAAKNSGHILTLTPKSPFATTPSFFSKERGGGGSGDGGGSDDPSGNSNKTAAVVQAMLSRSWSSMVGPPRVEESPFDNPRRLRKVFGFLLFYLFICFKNRQTMRKCLKNGMLESTYWWKNLPFYHF